MNGDYDGRRKPLALERPANNRRIDKRSTAVWPNCPLTQRQLEVIQHLAEGLSWADVAKEMGLSYKTPIEHTQRAFERLGIPSGSQGRRRSAHIVAIAMREGWIE